MISVKIAIDRKREGRALETGEIREIVERFSAGDIPDYQMSALAMAICCRGMDERETADLTDAMTDSGARIEWEGPSADKHSTGGVGDKISFLCQSIACACGVKVPSLTGRALGLTGGTADKLETIPGFNAALSLDEMRDVVERVGMAMTVQTAEIAPADRKLYALRDVTGTVASIPLITASILSKKIAEGAGTLVFDVKRGLGAFMKTQEEAEAMAACLVAGARRLGRKADAVVSDMDAPLGFAVGNANEVAEALAALGSPRFAKGRRIPEDVISLSLDLARRMVSLALSISPEEARAMCEERLRSGAALAKFEAMVAAQGGDLDAFERLLLRPVHKFTVQSAKSGVVRSVDASVVAKVALALGAGREKAGDAIDPLAGVTLALSRGERACVGSPLATITCSKSPDRLEPLAGEIMGAFGF